VCAIVFFDLKDKKRSLQYNLCPESNRPNSIEGMEYKLKIVILIKEEEEKFRDMFKKRCNRGNS